MQIIRKNLTPTSIKLTITAEPELLRAQKDHVLRDLSRDTRLQGFRPGKAPLSVVEKNVDQSLLQSQFLDHVLNILWREAIDSEKLRPVIQPKVSVTKFVPFLTLEAEFEAEVIGPVKLPDYKKIKLAKPVVKVDAKDVDEVLESLSERAATKQPVERAAKDGDSVTIDFEGRDTKTNESIDGADGTDYPLTLGSNSFIPGFEPELIGLKAGGEKEFGITFPKDYGVKSLQSRKVTFKVKVHTVEELTKPKLDDTFASTVGPFRTFADLKADIKKQLTADRNTQAQRDYESELLGNIAEKVTVSIPDQLIEEEIDRIEADERQNLVYRGQTWEEHLKAENVTEKQHRDRQREGAEARIKAGLALSEIAEQEGIKVSTAEIDLRVKLLKGQYQDEAMQAELDKPEGRRDIASRLLTEKTMAKLAEYAQTAK